MYNGQHKSNELGLRKILQIFKFIILLFKYESFAFIYEQKVLIVTKMIAFMLFGNKIWSIALYL